MRHRIAAGVLVEHEGKLLFVRHRKVGAYDFWVAPGGGAEAGEDLWQTAKREALEESGLLVEPERLVYIEDLCTPEWRECKLWFCARWVGGALDVSAPEAAREHIVEAAFLSPAEFEGKIVFPPMVHRDYWVDRAAGFPRPRCVGLRELEFYEA